MNLPSREECEGWDHAHVAFFMCQNKMQECATTVIKLRINGQRLLNLSDSDMSKFSLLHQPQLQKLVEDIKKKDGSLLNKIKRLTSKPVPKVPARDYRDDGTDDPLSDSDYDNDMYEDLHDYPESSYEPPPSHRAFIPTPSASLPRGEYLDSCRNEPGRPPRKPLRPSKASKQLPPEPIHPPDEEDYINPDCINDDDNYVEPTENQPANSMKPHRSRAGMNSSILPPSLNDHSPSADFYEVPGEEESTISSPASRPCPIPTTQLHSLPPKPSPRQNLRRSPPPVQYPTEDVEYEVCDPEDDRDKLPEGPPPLKPKPLLRERSPNPPLKQKPDLKPRGFKSQTMPLLQTDHKPVTKASTLDLKLPKIPPPHFTSLKLADRQSDSAGNRSVDEDKSADVNEKPWYTSTCDRRTADDILHRLNKDGAFLVRKSSGHDAQQPYTLVVFYKSRVYNIPIRFLSKTQQYALGREKKGEEYFSSVAHIIENHQKNLLVLIDGQSNSKDATKLCYPVTP